MQRNATEFQQRFYVFAASYREDYLLYVSDTQLAARGPNLAPQWGPDRIENTLSHTVFPKKEGQLWQLYMMG